MTDSFRGGYLKALLDVKNYFDSHSDYLKYERMFNSKKIPLLLQAFIDNADRMMIEGDQIELVFVKNKDTKEMKIVINDFMSIQKDKIILNEGDSFYEN